MPQVPMQRTRQTAPELAVALTNELKGQNLPNAIAANQAMGAILLAHILIETAGGDAIWNHNVGNITTSRDEDQYWQPTEGPASKLKFRVYPSLADGVRGYVGFLRSRPKMLQAASSGDLGAFSERIKADGYNPAVDVPDAAAKLLKLAEGKQQLFASLPPGPALTNSQAPEHSSPKGRNVGLLVFGVLVLAGAGALLYLSKHRSRPEVTS